MRRIDLNKANVARSNTIRNINRQIVLNYVRERAPISRAEIAHETALQRSTVSLIVEELRVEGLIEEISGESTGGRPPLLLSLRTANAVAMGVDVGTTRTIVATSDLPLEKSLELFEQGIRLSRECQERLSQAERKIEVLLRDNQGRPVASPYDQSRITTEDSELEA
jgi:exodeoxyribonuclease VII small subunit